MASRTESNNRYLHSYQSKGTHWGAGELYAEAYDILLGFPAGSDGKDSACNSGDPGSVPESGRSPGEGHGNPLQYSCLENPWTEEPGGLSSGIPKSRTQLND